MYPVATDDHRPVRFEFDGDRGAARREVEREMAPADVEVIAQELSKLAMLTKRRQGEESGTRLLIAAYLERLSEVPADMALYALKEAPNRSPWFPSWHELYALFEDALHERKLMLEAVA